MNEYHADVNSPPQSRQEGDPSLFRKGLWLLATGVAGVVVLVALFAAQSILQMVGLIEIGSESTLVVVGLWWAGCLVVGGMIANRLGV